jgi:two-component system sensor histidine kinase KdpD
LRELALKEVASHVERKVENEVPKSVTFRHERLLACISSNEETARKVIRKTARLAGYYNSKWFVLYVQTPREHHTKIPLDKQRYLINHFKLATELGAEIIRSEHSNISVAILEAAEKHEITTICIGKPHLSLFRIIRSTNIFNALLKKLSSSDIDLIILS